MTEYIFRDHLIGTGVQFYEYFPENRAMLEWKFSCRDDGKMLIGLEESLIDVTTNGALSQRLEEKSLEEI